MEKRRREGEEAYMWKVRGRSQTVVSCGAFEYLSGRSFGTSKQVSGRLQTVTVLRPST
jgi:hypothetical protein